MVALRTSPLARRIIAFNLLGILFVISGVLWAAPFRAGLVEQRQAALVTEARLTAALLGGLPAGLPDGELRLAAEAALGTPTAALSVFDSRLLPVASAEGRSMPPPRTLPAGGTYLTDALDAVWMRLSPRRGAASAPSERAARLLSDGAEVWAEAGLDAAGQAGISAAALILRGPLEGGAVVLETVPGEVDRLARAEREQVLRMLVVSVVVAIAISLFLASTIATPLAALSEAVEAGRDRDARAVSGRRVRIPDLTERPDEVGRLSGALRGLVAALYDRIDANEAFAADVAHEIKNPLASLKSAVGSLRIAAREDQRERLLGIIEQDVGRLDRLVSDISNASRLDSELVREEEQEFDLVAMVEGLVDHLASQATERGIDVVRDLPPEPITVRGLEPRLAQVVVNIVGNAVSFCEEGDTIRVWIRRRGRRVLLVCEDTGPGIPEESLDRIFRRFYSERPASQFGSNSGLGLAISRQIVEAHGGVIWAENIRPTEADFLSEPLGARLVVGLPL